MSQTSRLLDLLKSGRWIRTDYILEAVYGDDHLGIARIGARIADLKNRGAVIEGRRDPKKPSLYWYRMTKSPVKNPESGPVDTVVSGQPPKPAQGTLFNMRETPWD